MLFASVAILKPNKSGLENEKLFRSQSINVEGFGLEAPEKEYKSIFL